MLREDRLTTAFQPLVEVDASEQVFAYECLMRGEEDGQLIAPYRMIEVARGADLMFQLDLAARLAAIKGAAKYKMPAKSSSTLIQRPFTTRCTVCEAPSTPSVN